MNCRIAVNADCLDFEEQITEQAILSGLRTRILGRKIYCFDSVDSTNQTAKYLAHHGAEEGTLIVAEEQTEGRGKRGRRWESVPGCGILASLIIRPQIPFSDPWKVTLCAAVSIAKAIQQLTKLHPTLKWPNDILIGGKKVAGILTEVTTQYRRQETTPLILGFGLNVNQRQEDFSEGNRQLATSLRIESGDRVFRTKLLQTILEITEDQLGQLEHPDYEQLLNQWRSLAVLGEEKRAKGSRRNDFEPIRLSLDT